MKVINDKKRLLFTLKEKTSGPLVVVPEELILVEENTFSKNTAFNKNFGTTVGTVVEGGTLGSNAYTSTVIPTNTNQLTNDSGFITDVSNKVDKVTGKSLIADAEITRLSELISDTQIEVSTSTNIQAVWNQKTILFTASCTITVPATLLSQYGFVFRTLAGVTVTWAITAPFTWETTPTTTPEKTTGSFMRRGNTNTILLDF